MPSVEIEGVELSASSLAMSPSEKEKRRREEKLVSFPEGNVDSEDDLRREDSAAVLLSIANIYNKAAASTMSPPRGESERKRRRKEGKQISFVGGKMGSEDDIEREESELKRTIDNIASDSTLSPSEGKAQKKKRRREEKYNSFEERRIGSEGDIRSKDSELKGNIDSKASNSTMSPPKGESEKKKRRREGKQISFEEGKIGSEDDIEREGSELKGNIDNKASDSTLSAEGKAQKKKRRRKENQNSFDMSRHGSELNGDMDSKASDFTMTAIEGGSEPKKRRQKKQNSFDEGKICLEDDIGTDERESNGNVSFKSSDSTVTASKRESKRKNRSREEDRNGLAEEKIGPEDDIGRKESESKGNIDYNASESTISPGKLGSVRTEKSSEVMQNGFEERNISREDAVVNGETESKVNMDSRASDSTMSPVKGESIRKKRKRDEKQNGFDEGNYVEETTTKGNIDYDASNAAMSPGKGESERKKRRREEKQNNFDGQKIGLEDDIGREETESKGNIDCDASDSAVAPGKGESKRKKRRREEKQNNFGVEKISREDDIGTQETEPKENIDCDASNSAVSPGKGESKRKKRRREEKQNNLNEGKIGREDDTVRKESESKGNIDDNASNSPASPAKGESKRKKRSREEKQNNLNEGKIGREDDIGREEIESKGNIDSYASNSAMSPAKGEPKRKKRCREEKQNDFEEGEIERDDISREESELKGNMDSKASDKSKRKKKSREEKKNSLEGRSIGREDAVSVEEGEVQGNVRNNASDSTISPSKGESKRRKTVRFEDLAKDDAGAIVPYITREKEVEDYAERSWKKDLVNSDLRYGKFTPDEDEMIKSGISNYIKMRGWDEKDGLEKVLHVGLHPDARGCWLQIAKYLPYRPVKQINARALRLLDRSKRGKWSAEELEELKNLHNQYGNDWKRISSLMDRTAQVCKDRWRHLKLVPTRKEGAWSQDEYDELCRLVRRSLRVKASTTAKTLDRREVREDINWESIAEEMQRDSTRCADAWYRKLISPMVSATKWTNEDDHLLLQRLKEMGAASEKTVDWDNILDHRDGELCMTRWQEMISGLGKGRPSSFDDKLELLAHRFAPHLLGIEEE